MIKYYVISHPWGYYVRTISKTRREYSGSVRCAHHYFSLHQAKKMRDKIGEGAIVNIIDALSGRVVGEVA